MQELLIVVQGSSVVQVGSARHSCIALLHYVMAQGLMTLSPSCVIDLVRYAEMFVISLERERKDGLQLLG